MMICHFFSAKKMKYGMKIGIENKILFIKFRILKFFYIFGFL